MKKNIFKLSLAFIATMMTFTSCSDDLVKDEIDADNAGDSSKRPSITLNAAENVTYESADIVATWTENGDEVIESGFIYSTNESFAPMEAIPNTDDTGSKTMIATLDLAPEQTYYAKAYAQTKNNGVAYSNTINFTTPVAPEFQDKFLFGDYEALDTDIESGEPDGDPYDVVITQKGISPTRIIIENVWGGGKKIEGVVDFDKKTISVDYTNVLGIHSSYGNIYMYGLVIDNGEISGYAKTTIATYDENGNIDFSPWAAHCSQGDFGFYTTSLKKK